MKPWNFPWRKQRRRLMVKQRTGSELTQEELNIVKRPMDINFRAKSVPGRKNNA